MHKEILVGRGGSPLAWCTARLAECFSICSWRFMRLLSAYDILQLALKDYNSGDSPKQQFQFSFPLSLYNPDKTHEPLHNALQ